MKNVFSNCLFVALAAVLGACSSYSNKSPLPSVSKEVRADLKRPVNCATAKQDVAALEEERASVAKQVLSGVRSVMPISVVAGLLMGDYSDRVSVASGQYNADIDAKIAQIRSTCGV